MILFKKFIRRISAGDYKNALYLTYYYTFLKIYDLQNKTNFCNSQMPEEYGSKYKKGSTGNFPAHPKLVKKFIQKCNIPKDTKIIDVGHGSGLPLHVAYQLGFVNLTGVEHGLLPYNLSKKNLSNKNVKLIHGDAFKIDYSSYDVIFFFSPFRGELAKRFFENISKNITTIITVNHDLIVEKTLSKKNYKVIYQYQHPIYKNFNGKIWKIH